jgi:rhamnosyltransferase
VPPDQPAGESVQKMSVAAATVLYRPDPSMLDALLTPLEGDGLRLFVFANGPLEEIVEGRLATSPHTTVIRAQENLGLGYGLNVVTEAAAAAGFAFVLLLDQDSVPVRGLAKALLSHIESLSSRSAFPPALVGPLLVSPESEAYLAPWYSRREAGGGVAEGAVDFLSTSGSLISIAAWQATGPFRADYFIDGIDVEWCFRAWSRGYACYLADDVKMPHRWGSAAENDERRPQILRQSPLRSYYYIRNSLYGLRLRHLPWRWRLRTVARVTAQALLLLLAHRFERGIRRLVLEALRDGLRARLGPIPPGIA